MTGLPVAVGELVGVDYLNEVARGHWRSSTLVDIVSSVTETDLLGTAGSGVSIVGGALSTNRKLRITIVGDVMMNAVSATGRLRLYYGAAAVFDSAAQTLSAGGATHFGMYLLLELAAAGATNAQAIGGICQIPSGNAAVVAAAFQPSGTAAVDSTIAQNLRVTWQWGTSSAAAELRAREALVEVI